MANKLPGRVAPLELARRYARIQVVVPVKRFRRLSEALYATDADIAVDLGFEPIDRDMVILRGTLEGTVRVVCQRCLQPMQQALRLTPAFQFRTQGAREVPDVDEALEPVEMDPDNTIDLADLIEDEIILGLPTVARHAPEACPARRMRFGPHLEQKPARENPFSVLEQLRRKPDSPESD